MTRLLVIDAATPACSVALFDGMDIVAGDYANLGRGHAERLVPMIAGLPDQGRADAIAVNCGPGSFTGIRVGLSAAMALGIAWNVPVNGYSCMAMVAQMAAQSGADGRLSVVMQAGHGEVSVQNFTVHAKEAEADLECALMSVTPAQAATIIGSRTVYGSGIDMLIESPQTNSADGSSDGFLLPDARAFPAADAAFANLPPKPIYTRAPDAKPSAQQPVSAHKTADTHG